MKSDDYAQSFLLMMIKKRSEIPILAEHDRTQNQWEWPGNYSCKKLRGVCFAERGRTVENDKRVTKFTRAGDMPGFCPSSFVWRSNITL